MQWKHKKRIEWKIADENREKNMKDIKHRKENTMKSTHGKERKRKEDFKSIKLLY